MMGANPLLGPHEPMLGPRFPDMTTVYDSELRTILDQVAQQLGQSIHHGVYAACSGPVYETPAEIRALKALGADVVGMSTVPEALIAVQLGMRVVGLSTITNVANPDAMNKTAGEEVVALAQTAEPKLTLLVQDVLRAFDDQ